MTTPCWCKRRRLNPENADYVVNEVPCCGPECYEQALAQSQPVEGLIAGMNRDTGCLVRIHA